MSVNVCKRLIKCCIVLSMCIYSINGCAEKPIDFDSAKNNFDFLYKKRYEDLWKFLHKNYKEIRVKGDSVKLSKFLSLLEVGINNAEYQGFMSESIEKIVLEKPELMDKALAICGIRVKNIFFEKIKRPIYYSYSEIQSSVKKKCEGAKCPELSRIIGANK